MPEILVPEVGQPEESGLLEVAESLAAVLRADVHVIELPEAAAMAVETLIDAVGDPEVSLAVLPGGSDEDALWWQVVQRVRKSVVVVPPTHLPWDGAVDRVLVPLDGSPEAASAVSEAARLLARSGVDLVALHVFDTAHAPRFWDQTAHACGAWTDEFLTRHLPTGSPRLELRSGTPGEHVVDVAASEGVDLIVLGWSRSPTPGRALTVRRTVAESAVPVLLCPVPESD